jgi:hypothetical protein
MAGTRALALSETRRGPCEEGDRLRWGERVRDVRCGRCGSRGETHHPQTRQEQYSDHAYRRPRADVHRRRLRSRPISSASLDWRTAPRPRKCEWRVRRGIRGRSGREPPRRQRQVGLARFELASRSPEPRRMDQATPQSHYARTWVEIPDRSCFGRRGPQPRPRNALPCSCRTRHRDVDKRPGPAGDGVDSSRPG